MNPTLTPLQRLKSPTPKFWIIVQVVCIILVAIAANLAKYQVIPNTAYLAVISAASAVVLISQFAVKDGALIAQLLADPSKLVEHLPEIIALFKQLNEQVQDPQAIGLPDFKFVPPPPPAAYPPMTVIPGGAAPQPAAPAAAADTSAMPEPQASAPAEPAAATGMALPADYFARPVAPHPAPVKEGA